MVKPGGQLGLWIYELNWKIFVGTAGFKYALRPITRRLPRAAQLRFCRTLVDVCHPIIGAARRFGWPGRMVMRLLPVASAHLQSVRLRPADFKTWLFLDTFDMYSPAYDSPQRFESVASLLRAEGFGDIRRNPHGALSITAQRS
jgi:hypothetical protein